MKLNHLHKTTTWIIVLFFLTFSMHGMGQIGFIENKGQWPDAVDAKFGLPNGALWLEDQGWTLSLINEQQAHEAHELHHQEHDHESILVDGHAIKVRIRNSVASEAATFTEKQQAYYNYFLGSNAERWGVDAGLYHTVSKKEILPGINLLFETQERSPKITFVLDAGVQPSALTLDYLGARYIHVEDEDLIIESPVARVMETGLRAYQILDGKEVEVDCRFVVDGISVSFRVGDYDAEQELFIDPVVVASTNSGSTTSCYGHTATFDNVGNIYGAGRAFGDGYPTDTGSFQVDFAQGGTDICLSKFNPDGSQLIYATYIGGTAADYPHSLYVNAQGVIHLLGSTLSSDYPVSFNAYDTSHNGSFDITLTILNPEGDSLVGSTYIGGADSDGNNAISLNYGDDFRGEIVVDGFNDIYVATMTQSQDFPATAGVVQDTFSGMQDGVVLKMNYNLSQLKWATFLGGAGNDVAYGLKLTDGFDIYIAGTTAGQGFPVDSNGSGAEPNFIGGPYDGFVLQLNKTGSAINHSSYFGTDTTDQNFFIQLDQNGEVYLFGQSRGGITASAGKYQGPTLGSFVYRTSAELDVIDWQAAFGSMAPTAFLVDLCSHIYIAGHNGLASWNTSTFDTLDAVFTAGAAGFYTMALSPDASVIEFGSFYGNGGSHVDGGTSRFDKRGIVYEATCSNGSFPTTSTAYSNNVVQNQAYDLTVFKIDFEVDAVVAYASVAPFNVGCAPFAVDFSNAGSEGSMHFWDFGDGMTSNDTTPSHTFNDPGIYEVTYVASDTTGCNLDDSVKLYITVVDTITPQLSLASGNCSDTVEIQVDSAYANMLWSTGEYTQRILTDSADTFWIEVTNQCGVFTDTLFVDPQEPYAFELMADTTVCEEDLTIDGPSTALSYQWNTGATTQSLVATSTGEYILTATDGVCDFADTVNIVIGFADFSSIDTVLCEEDSLVLSVKGEGSQVTWSTGETTDSIVAGSSGIYWALVQNNLCSSTDTVNLTLGAFEFSLGPDTTVCEPFDLSVIDSTIIGYIWSDGETDSALSISATGTYWIEVDNGICTAIDSIDIIRLNPGADSLIPAVFCDVSTGTLFAQSTGQLYEWNTGENTPAIVVNEGGEYSVRVLLNNCAYTDTFGVRFGAAPDFELGDNIRICRGEEVVLSTGIEDGTTFWNTSETTPDLTVRDTGLYVATVTVRGCSSRDSLRVSQRNLDLSKLSAIGNVFSPNRDGLNDVLNFSFEDEEIITRYSLTIFNRWGGEVYRSSDARIHWDGTNQAGEPQGEGVYFYIIEVETSCQDADMIQIRDNVTLLR